VRRVWVALALALGAAALGEAVLLAFLWQRQGWQRSAASTPVARGAEIASRLGCFGCHGPGGVRPIPNPGARSREVPDWSGGTWMMWNHDERDVRAWIEDGRSEHQAPDRGALIAMPAYGDLLSDEETDDLVAFVLAVSLFGQPDDPAAQRGRNVVVRFGCFGCHGPEGRGVVPNPGSFKGYVPAWDGDDFAEVVRDDDEFRQWVRRGVSDRFAANPAARVFLERQRTRMPAYADAITAAELDDLLAYVKWIRATPRGRRAAP